MTSLFESTVSVYRNAVPWATIDLPSFLKDIAQNSFEDAKLVTLSCLARPDVSSRFWWTLTWTSVDGEERTMAAATLELCLWRAAIREKQLKDKAERVSQEVV